MPRKIFLLTGKREVPFLEQFILARQPAIEVISATNRNEFQSIILNDLNDTRLLCFCSGVLVPKAVLNRLNLEPYNIHPGSPNYPGICPEAFAVANGAKKFGATAHVITEKIDEGEIVATNSFSVPKNTDRLALASLAYNAAVELFATVASFVFENDGKMPRSGEKWQGNTNRQADYYTLLKEHPELIVEHPK